MLTGTEEVLLPEARRGHKNAQPVDNYPFIWKDFERKGYITHFFEDAPTLGCFNYRLLGFRDQPVHHFMRPFYIAMERKNLWSHIKGLHPLCLGSVPKYEIGLNSLMESFHTNVDQRGRPIFAMNFLSDMSHNDNNKAQLCDNSTVKILRHLGEHGFLDKTIVVLFSDHGARFSSVRRSERGKLEERMPYFGFLFPKWFESKYKLEMDNFRVNTKRLVTPFDVHATLDHILNYRKPRAATVNEVGISLFDEMPPERTCAHARVESHWCACMNWQNVDTNDGNVTKAALATIEYINKMLDEYPENCNKLMLKSIQTAKIYAVDNAVLAFEKSADVDGRVPSLKDNMKRSMFTYQVTFVTQPGDAMLEATVRKDIPTDKFIPNEKEISRLNKYGNAPSCIAKKAPHLRPYCLCK